MLTAFTPVLIAESAKAAESMTNDAPVHSRVELDHILANLEAAIRVKQRSDFFSWVQGVFQGMIAHDALICALPNPPGSTMMFEWVSSYPIAQEQFAELCRADDGLLRMLIDRWVQQDRKPILYHADTEDRSAQPIVQLLRGFGLSNVLAHGLPGPDLQPAAFFAFFRLPATPGGREERMLSLLVPYLHAAWLSAHCSRPNGPIEHAAHADTVLTEREIEILRWVEQGKSNGEIGQILNISHLTVKNHVQKILRKLDVHNRAQAVARGIALRLTTRASAKR